jgi:hypothetical protein
MRTRIWFLLVVVVAAGCGSSGPFEYTPVNGTVEYEDGSLLPGSEIRLVFVPQDVAAVGGAHPRMARAIVNAQGVFDCVTSYKYGDGLIPGTHKVVFQVAVSQDGKSIVPTAYTNVDATPLVIDTADAPLVIKVPKP